MRRTRIKICGLSNIEEALRAVDCGADAIGLVFYEKSSRAVSIAQAKAIYSALPAFVSIVGLFVNPSRSEVEQVLAQVPLDCLQFHGEETPDFCASFSRPYMKAIRVQDGLDVNSKIREYADSRAILLDSYSATSAGGTGEVFDWSIAQQCVAQSKLPIVLAGGLEPDNVAQAIKQVRPYAVDVSSGVESAPGRKSEQRMKAFINEVYSV
ncbi:MAG: phosphoribosylanthranilate isomerase [Pseudohongiellaceae bacterium]|nr:phosphoribosylanthranilate isomerase [Pseudohongiellaceae bacterium]